MSTRPIRILIVDDSPTARAALRLAFEDDPSLEVVGEAADGATATRLVEQLGPDLVTMDIYLKAENGLDVAAAIMAKKATPIVAITAADPRDPQIVFRAMQVGVLEVNTKLPSPTHPDYEARRARLVRTLKTLARVPVVHRFLDALGKTKTAPTERRPPSSGESPQPRIVGGESPPAPRSPLAAPRTDAPAPSRSTLAGSLLLGASTGGPQVLAAILRALPKPFPMPIAIVQHMTPGFIGGFAQWLASDTGHEVTLVDASRPLEPGRVFITRDEYHLVLEPGRRIGVSSAPARGFHRPSVDSLFESAARQPEVVRSIGILLTGMGSDGAAGLLALRRAGAQTIAQKPATCTVSSMPSRAIELGAAQLVLDPQELVSELLARTSRES